MDRTLRFLVTLGMSVLTMNIMLSTIIRFIDGRVNCSDILITLVVLGVFTTIIILIWKRK